MCILVRDSTSCMDPYPCSRLEKGGLGGVDFGWLSLLYEAKRLRSAINGRKTADSMSFSAESFCQVVGKLPVKEGATRGCTSLASHVSTFPRRRTGSGCLSNSIPLDLLRRLRRRLLRRLLRCRNPGIAAERPDTANSAGPADPYYLTANGSLGTLGFHNIRPQDMPRLWG
ncbi:hypothetical protein M431DRAFT_329423 [Trichoderma harzianum CBS 226.95]|uniref:Uncharacterized protein n=1 Tax=Trichoderma harzianum CBS 226.95 TaxID=983964 RepID=A0A2T3ZU81_TRIHA|nr:hypothetical protein M431DRAFT_329423 [Trichoderma harzianum CBS 226.95]PTB48356.1 hypothetical protein M431DRAFT_329423 [Trichoderma harzianum CBS 226.95]